VSAPRTGVYVICARNVQRTGRAGHSRAQVDFFADVVHIALLDMIRLGQIIHMVVFLAYRFQVAEWC